MRLIPHILLVLGTLNVMQPVAIAEDMTTLPPVSTSSEAINAIRAGAYNEGIESQSLMDPGTNPKGLFVDWCYDLVPDTNGNRCGKPVADALCKLRGRSEAIDFNKAANIGRFPGVVTRMLGNNAIECTHPENCDGITELKCSDSVEPEAASSTMEPVTDMTTIDVMTTLDVQTEASTMPPLSTTTSDGTHTGGSTKVTEQPSEASETTTTLMTITDPGNGISTTMEPPVEGEHGLAIGKFYVNYCYELPDPRMDGEGCGRRVADELCKLWGQGKAISYRIVLNISRFQNVKTKTLGDPSHVCSAPDQCDGITRVECIPIDVITTASPDTLPTLGGSSTERNGGTKGSTQQPESTTEVSTDQPESTTEVSTDQPESTTEVSTDQPESTTEVSTRPETCFHVYENQQATGTVGLLQATASPDQATCEQVCRELSGCKAYSFWPETKYCYLREHLNPMVASSSANSGIMIDCEDGKYVNFKEVCIEQYAGFFSPGSTIHLVQNVPDQEMCLQKCNLQRNCFALTYTKREGKGNLCRLKTRLSEAMVPTESQTTSTLLKDCSSRSQMSIHIKEGRTYSLDILRIIHGIQRKGDCEMICSLDKNCMSLIFYQSDQTCVLRKSLPSLITSDELATTTSAIRLPNRYQYFFDRSLAKRANFFDKLEDIIHVGQCAEACTERGSKCSFFSYSMSELKCSLGRATKALKEEDTAPSEGIIIGSTRQKEVCGRFPGKRSGTMKGFLRIINHLLSEEDCSARCLELSKCRAYTYFSRGTCWLHRRLDKSSLEDHHEAVVSVEYGDCHKSKKGTSFQWVNGGLDENLFKAFWSASNEECRKDCLGESSCHMYTFYSETGSCLFLREIQNVELIRTDESITTGIRLTGDYEAYKWRHFDEDAITSNFIKNIGKVYHVRSCEEKCSATEGCTGYSYQFIKYVCTLLRNVGDDELMENHGNSIAGFRVSNSIGTDGSSSGGTDESEDGVNENETDEKEGESGKNGDKKKKTDKDEKKSKKDEDEKKKTDKDYKKGVEKKMSGKHDRKRITEEEEE